MSLTSDYCTLYNRSLLCVCAPACFVWVSIWILNRVKSENKVRNGKSTLYCVDEVYHRLCWSVSQQGQLISPICFKMPQVVTLTRDLAEEIHTECQVVCSALWAAQMVLTDLSGYSRLCLTSAEMTGSFNYSSRNRYAVSVFCRLIRRGLRLITNTESV